jgi:hypothetical protein
MADNLEPRVEVNLTVRIWGMDADGRPFIQNVYAQNISEHGAKLSGIAQALKVGDVIGVQFADKKARCKVIWVIEAGHLQKIQAGVQVLEGQPSPWQEEAAHGDKPRAASGCAASGDEASQPKNQRRFERHKIAFPIEIQTDKGNTHMRTQATDIGGRGCYVETMLPLALGTLVNITFWLDSDKIVTPAVVRTCDGGVGMGIEFTGLDEKIQIRLQDKLQEMSEGSKAASDAQSAT